MREHRFDYTFRGNKFSETQFYQSFEAINKGTILYFHHFDEKYCWF